MNCHWLNTELVREHLICDGFMRGYSKWFFHGEGSTLDRTNVCMESETEGQQFDDMDAMLRNGLGFNDFNAVEGDGDVGEHSEDVEKFYKLAADASQDLYPRSKMSKLQFIIKLLHVKFLGGWSNSSFDELLVLLKEAFPMEAQLPDNFHAASKIVKSLGLGYINIDACKNDCIQFRKEYENAKTCPSNTSRWKVEKTGIDGKRVHKVPQKVLRYFPLKKRLQRLFMSEKTASDMRWHAEGRTKDGLLRHPADSPAWKNLDQQCPIFGAESRNIRLALATDGFNPFGNMSVSHSTWPVVLIPYNPPPWLCMKQHNFILSLLIPGPTQPGNDMDVYFEPLVDELLDLFEQGVKTYDVSHDEWFQLRAAILYTITDLPGLGYVSGHPTSGKFACQHCHLNTCSLYLKKGMKTCYLGHRRFLPQNHSFRFDEKSFDGTKELRDAPVQPSGHDILKETENLNVVFGKAEKKKRKRKDDDNNDGGSTVIWKKRSCFFRLPYWEHLLVRHNLDIMHIEKNVCDNIVNTLLNVDRKSKDNLNSRLDLQSLGIKQDLHPVMQGTKVFLPPAAFSLSAHEKKLFYQVLKDVKFPDGYASNI